MKSNHLAFHLLAGLLAVPSALGGFLFLLLALLLLDNFNLQRGGHALVFGFTMVGPFLALAGYVLYLRRQTWRAFAWSMAGSASLGITLLFWSSPLSRGLMH
jgi:hypothetical protein